MTEERTSLEIIAPSIEEAIAEGVQELGLPEEAVDIEILDIGSKGVFGLGVRQSRVRLTVKASLGGAVANGISESVPVPTPPAASEAVELEEDVEGEDEITSETGIDAEKEEVIPEEHLIVEEEPVDEIAQDEIVLHVAQATVEELLEKMGIVAQVSAHFGEPDDAHSRIPLVVDVNGDDLSILIGPRAETLNALQYISSLIIGKELGRSVPLVVDVEGYRRRRKEALVRLAERMADQAMKTGRTQHLEPMPANERRLVHIALRGNPEVTTESIGVEPRRKVTIIPVNHEVE
jgi:spoIIIJ-associated protein